MCSRSRNPAAVPSLCGLRDSLVLLRETAWCPRERQPGAPERDSLVPPRGMSWLPGNKGSEVGGDVKVSIPLTPLLLIGGSFLVPKTSSLYIWVSCLQMGSCCARWFCSHLSDEVVVVKITYVNHLVPRSRRRTQRVPLSFIPALRPLCIRGLSCPTA